MDERGVIKNPERCRQLIEFRHMLFGDIAPMDVDAMIEYKGMAYLFYEFKLDGATMPYGQRLALERLADDCTSAGKKAVVFLCEHHEEDARKIVDAGNAIVKSVYFGDIARWRTDIPIKTVSEWTKSFMEYVTKQKGEKQCTNASIAEKKQ